MLGPSDGVVMLAPMREDGVLGIAEGIETSLAAAKIFGIPTWAALSAGNMPGCSLIGISKSSILETDALAGVTVLFGVSSMPPHHGCQG